jgi:endoglucanase
LSGILQLSSTRRRRSPASANRAATWAGLLLIAAALPPSIVIGLAHDPSPAGLAARDARAFLGGYVDPHGRVVRRDQAGDTVSEGQAYAMLLAQSVGDSATFARVWRWTQVHLQRPDGLFAYLTSASGRIRDATPAADADVLIAWSLGRAVGPHAAAYHAEARRVASAILRRETARRGGMLLLAAGPWATGAPVSIDPSYWAPEAFTGLARLTRDRRWLDVTRSSLALAVSITRDGTLLPPDWARVDASTPTPTPAPNGQVPRVQYGLDAQRLVVWLGAGCEPAGRRLTARWASMLSTRARSRALALSTRGSVISTATNALPLVAAAAAAQAAGDTARRDRLLAEAASTQAGHPTYYGAAWLALGRTLLTTSALGGCAAAAGGG